MTAHNSAGSSVEEYDFTTLTFGGATVAPELIIHSEYTSPFSKPIVILPVVLAFTLTASLVFLAGHHYFKVKRNRVPGGE